MYLIKNLDIKFNIFISIILLLFMASCGSKIPQAPAPEQRTFEGKKPTNIVLLIGDGMGLSQISSAMIESGDSMNLNRFSNIGFITTHSADNLVTDSGAGATAFATGQKTKNGYISVDENGNSLKTFLELAEERNFMTGLITTSAITHATPAAFVAHVNDRDDEEAIAEYILRSDVDVMMGGGRKFFDQRNDGRDLVMELQKRGYKVGNSLNQISRARNDKFVGFIADGDPAAFSQGRGEYLVEAWRAAFRIFSKNDNPFFLMIEGAQIDWAGHGNNLSYLNSEMLEFDRAIGDVLNYAQDGETLVIVLGDHETGGLAINGGSHENRTVEGAWTTKKHTATLIPVFAYGPGAELFRGIYDNTDVFDKMRYLLFGEGEL